MSPRDRADGGVGLGLAILRATLLAVVFVSAQLNDPEHLDGTRFYVMLGLAVVYAGAGLALAIRDSDDVHTRTLARMQPAFDVFMLCGLAATSGGAYSDVRKAFYVIPLAAAFSERPFETARWSLIAAAAFTAQAMFAGGALVGISTTWRR